MKKIISIIGARPQFIKYAPLSLEMQGKILDIAIHTGQHYDQEMSDVFFRELNISEPKYHLNAGSGTHGAQTGRMLADLDPILIKEKPDAVIVYGDTNSTLAGALSASKLTFPLIHIEAGLRSFNRTMPEELNRVVTDHLSDLLFAPTQEAVDNLKKEGIKGRIEIAGDLMADSLRLATGYLAKNNSDNPEEDYYLATIHRNYNTDDRERLGKILKVMNELDHKVIFPMHPRTVNNIAKWNIDQESFRNIEIIKSLGYFSFINYLRNSKAVITDSGGIQKEAYMLKKPCVTLRYETEWVETLDGNWNVLAGNELDELDQKLSMKKGVYRENLYGDGYSAKSITEAIINFS